MGSSVAYKTIGTFLSQDKRHEDACGSATGWGRTLDTDRVEAEGALEDHPHAPGLHEAIVEEREGALAVGGRGGLQHPPDDGGLGQERGRAEEEVVHVARGGVSEEEDAGVAVRGICGGGGRVRDGVPVGRIGVGGVPVGRIGVGGGCQRVGGGMATG